MTPEEVNTVWKSQHLQSHTAERLEKIVVRKTASTKRQVTWSLVFAVGYIALGGFNFYGQHVVNGDSLIVSLLRALPVLALIPIQFFVYRSSVREHRERLALLADHRAWLTQWVAGLEAEVRGDGRLKLAAFTVFVVTTISIAKWLDYQNGEDSLAECIGIPMAAAMLCLLVAIGVWHYRTQFLVPELFRCRKMLEEFDKS